MIREVPFGDPVVLAGAAALCGGAFAVLDPFFRGLTEASAALAVVAWIPRICEPRPGARTSPSAVRVLGAVAGVAASGIAFLFLPPPLDRLGALFLGVGAAGLSAWVPATPSEPAP
jgi:hypothetical protein